MAVTVSPYLITLDPQVGYYTAADLWNAWRAWVLIGGHKYYPAFEQSGGAPLIGSDVQPLYLFLQNQYGWRITSSDPTEFVFIDCNLFGADPDTTIYAAVTGVQPPIQIERSVKASAILSGSGLSTAQALQLEAIHKAHMNRRGRNPTTRVITVYDDDGTTPFAEFDSAADMSEITPR